MTHDKLLLLALRREIVPRLPIWLMRQAGRYLPEYRELRSQAGSFLDLCLNPELAVEVTLQPIRRYGFDASILFSDILIVPHGLGQKLWFEEGSGPRLEALSGAGDLARLSGEGLRERLAPVYETVARLRAELPPACTLIGFAGAPWTVATYMVEGGGSKDFAATKAWAYGDPEGFQRLIDLLVEATLDHLGAQVEAGAEVIQLFDTWAGALPEAQLRRWCLEPARDIVHRLKARYPDVPVILFPRGAGPLYCDYAAESGAEGLSLDTALPLDWAAQRLQGQVTLQGNLDPHALVAGGSALREGVQGILARLGGGPFVFNLGHGIVPQTPPEHVGALVEMVREWRG